MKISDTIERIGDELIITGRRNIGFGSRRTDVPRRDVARILPTDEFERMLIECMPTGHHVTGLNAGAPVDGLSELSWRFRHPVSRRCHWAGVCVPVRGCRQHT